MASCAVDVPEPVLSAAVIEQVCAYDARFLKGLQKAREATSAKAQVEAFGRRDGTGVEAVHDVMPAEGAKFQELVMEACNRCASINETGSQEVYVLDFGCGDGRYLQQYVRTVQFIQRSFAVNLKVVAYDVSVEALRSFHFRAERAGLTGSDEIKHTGELPPLASDGLSLDFVLGSGEAGTVDVEKLLKGIKPVFDVIVIGWGTLSCIPRLPSISPEALLAAFAQLGRCVMNVVSTTNNHVKFQREFKARRQALQETNNEAVKRWLQSKIGLATSPGSYYYPVDTGERMFYAATTGEQEINNMRAAGFSRVALTICNVNNFFDILTKPRVARLNNAVITLLERRDVWGAQLLLSRGVAKALGQPLSSLRRESCIFDASTEFSLMGQVARYFISVGFSEH